MSVSKEWERKKRTGQIHIYPYDGRLSTQKRPKLTTLYTDLQNRYGFEAFPDQKEEVTMTEKELVGLKPDINQ